MNPAQITGRYLTDIEYDRYSKDCDAYQKAKAAVEYWEALAKLRYASGDDVKRKRA